MDLHGVNPILPTPFTDGGELDIASLERLIDFQLAAGVDGVAILGFLGEAHKLAEAERRTVIETVVARAGGAIPVWVGVRALGTAGAIEQARAAQALGATAVFVAPIAPQNDQALYEHFRAVARAVDVPLIVHDYPASFGITLAPELVARLANDGYAPYIKLEDPPVLSKLSRIRELTDGKIGVFGGLGGEYFLEELQRGALGIMTGFAFPEVLVAIYRQFTGGDEAGAARTFDQYMPLIRYEFQPKIGLAFRKHIYQRRGVFDSAHIRPPGMALDEVSREELENLIARVGLRLEPTVHEIR
jgi:4-hydroxy-tetrahydrodipicolinate synthase